MHKWYVVQVVSGQEKRVKKAIEENRESKGMSELVNGVLGFLGGEKPQPLAQSEVDALLKDLEEKKKGVVQKHNITAGDKVKITDGVFVNFVGTVQEVFHDKGRLSVLVSIFGRETRVDDLEFWQVEQAPTESE